MKLFYFDGNYLVFRFVTHWRLDLICTRDANYTNQVSLLFELMRASAKYLPSGLPAVGKSF
jgi:hypothetical protein